MASNYYVQFEEPAITGTAGGNHGKEIEVLSWNHGFVQPEGPGTTGAATMHQNFTFTKYLDASSNELMKYCWTAKPFGKVTLSFYRESEAHDPKPMLYMRVTMRHVIIANYHVSGGPGDIPTENIALDYGTIQYEYMPQSPGAVAKTVVAAKHLNNDAVAK